MEAQPASQLAVILHADVVGSTDLVQRDESLAHRRIQDAFQRFSAIIRDYGGITSELRGDALVAEFRRASDAACAALAFQRDNLAVNKSLHDDIRPQLRVGIGMGEVVIADDTVTGAGVVLAQRLEQLADPDGVCIQGAAYETMPRRLSLDYESLGEQSLKGFDEPIRAYAVSLRDGTVVPPPQTPETSGREGVDQRWVAASVAALLLVAGGAIAWWQPWVTREEPARVERMAYPLPDKPSIAVLPFNNMSGQAEQEYFVDGMTEDLITDLSNIPELFVIARNSSFTYKGRSVDVKQVSRELGVKYVLEGSVRRAGDRVRINAQLIDAVSGGHVWAERYDGMLQDVFALQDQVTRKIVTALRINLADDLSPRTQHTTGNIDAHDAFLRGWASFKLETHADLARSIPHFERAIEIDPGYSQAHAALASVYWDAYVDDWAFDIDMPSFRAEARANEHLEKALEQPTTLAYSLQSRMFISFGRLEDAVTEAELAVSLDGNDATAHAALANALVLVGKPEEGRRAIDTAMRLDPHHPPGYLTILGATLFNLELYEEAIGVLQRAMKRDPQEELPRIFLAASFAHLDLIDDAEEAVEELNFLRDTRGLNYLSLEQDGFADEFGPFGAKVDIEAFGSKANQERLRAGLSGIPAMKWQYLVTTHVALDPGNTWWEVNGATEIDVETAKTLHDRGVLFIDVSVAADWGQRHIPDAINLPHAVSSTPRYRQTALRELVGPTDEFVVYWCPINLADCGLRAAFDAAKAVAWGYQKVYWLGHTGPGLKEWIEAGYPVESAD